MILFLLGCWNPPLLDAVQRELGVDAVETGSASIRRFVAISQIVGEIGVTDTLDDMTWSGGGCLTLGCPDVTEDNVERPEDGEIIVTISPVGIDGEMGTLVLTTDSSLRTFNFSYSWAGQSLDGELIAASKSDTSGEPVGVASGRATEQVDDDVAWALTISGRDPLPGIGFSAASPRYPVSGSVRWDEADDGSGRKIVLEDALDVDVTQGTWPGTASDADWEAEVEVPFP